MRKAKFWVYRDAKREWRWRLKASNGKIIADSGEGYTRRRNVMKAVMRMGSLPRDAKVEVVLW